jgi:hypothetical protein
MIKFSIRGFFIVFVIQRVHNNNIKAHLTSLVQFLISLLRVSVSML